MGWEAANARARGLATHLLDRRALLGAADQASWSGAARAIVARGFPVAEQEMISPEEFDRAAGRIQATRMALLGRWLGKRRGALAVLYEDEARRTLRRLLRGAVQGASPGARLQGTIPTPDLPERVLNRLARAESPARLADGLLRLGHPAGRALLATRTPATGGDLPGLWRLEAALARLFATRATRAARRAGHQVRRLTALLIDLENAWTARASRNWGPDMDAGEVFLPGGQVLDRERFTVLIAMKNQDQVSRELAMRFTGTPFHGLFADAHPALHLESRALATLVAWQRGEARMNPLGPGVVLGVLFRIRAEIHDVRLVLASAGLGGARSAVEVGLVTA